MTPIMVFVPLVFLGGVTGVFFRALAMTLVTALLASLFLAIFFTPVLASVFLRRRAADVADEHPEQAGEGAVLRWLTHRYERALHWVLYHPRTVLLSSRECWRWGWWGFTSSSAPASCRIWMRARSCSTTSLLRVPLSRRPTAFSGTSGRCSRKPRKSPAIRDAPARVWRWPSPNRIPATS